MNITELNQQFASSGQIEFKAGNGGLPEVQITNKYAQAIVSLYGAQVLSYRPDGQNEVLWMSETSSFEAGKAIRGGIPVCFPWFGPHVSDNQKPMHGFARLMIWDVLEASVSATGESKLRLGLVNNDYTHSIWPYAFRAEMAITIGAKLNVSLTYTNTGNESFVCSDALHSYLRVSDISNISLAGLAGCDYYQGFSDLLLKQEELVLVIRNEENRRYINHTADCIITDDIWKRKIMIAKKGSKGTVVWNPGSETASKMSDIHADGYLTFVCVEAANIYKDVVTLAPMESFSITTIIGLE